MKKIWTRLLVVFAAILLLPITVLATNLPDGSQLLRVGYVENMGVVSDMLVAGSEGYAYEYLNKIFEYTQENYTLEFVQVEGKEEGYELLESGDIDLFGLVSYDETIDEQFAYNQTAFAENTLFLISDSYDSIDTVTYEQLEGSNIGIISSSNYLTSFLDQYDITANIIVLPDDNYVENFDTYDLDYCVISAQQLSLLDGSISILSQIGLIPLYVIATDDNQALLDDLDYGIEQVDQCEYQYQETLYLKYYDYDIIINSYISDEEYALLQEQDVYYVGMENRSSPFTRLDSNGELQGIALEVVEMLEEQMGITCEVILIDDDTSQAQLDKIDLFVCCSDELVGELKNTVYLELPLFLITHGTAIDTADEIGVLSYYGITSSADDGTLFGQTLLVYDNVVDITSAFNGYEIDSMVLTTTSLNYIRSDITDANYVAVNFGSNMTHAFYYSESMSVEKIEVFEKVLTNLDDVELEYALFQYSSNTEVTLFDYVKSHPIVLVAIFLGALLLVTIFNLSKQRAISKRVNYDLLTGLISFHKFSKKLRKIRLTHPRRAYNLISIDIDNFKYINEIYGYELGTKVLKKVSSTLKSTLPKRSLVTRIHADEFLVFTRQSEKIDQQKREQCAEALQQDITRILGSTYRLSFSIGIYTMPTKRMPISYMVDCASIARETGKGTRGTTINHFSEQINVERARNNEITASMEEALKNEEFFLQYQPKVDLETEELLGAEALVRWKRGDKIVPPNDFIPLFEKNGFIQSLDLYVLEHACMFLKKNKKHRLPKISVNLSSVSIANPDLTDEVMAVLERQSIQPSEIDLEITESAFVGNKIAQQAVEQLVALGFNISMDDFGVGVSSLNRLKSLKIHTLKIDRAFVIDYLNNEKGAIILKSIISMASLLGIQTVAEGIETKEQAESLLRYGCDVGQGYFYSRPIDGNEFVKKYSNKPSLLS